MNMAGPPLAPSSNVNKQKEGKTEEQSCPKRRRKSIDDSNNIIPEDPGQEPTAAGETPTQTDDGELGFRSVTGCHGGAVGSGAENAPR